LFVINVFNDVEKTRHRTFNMLNLMIKTINRREQMKNARILFLLLVVLSLLVLPDAPTSANAVNTCQTLEAACQDPVSFTCGGTKAVCETFSPAGEFAAACEQVGGSYNATCPIIDLWPCIEICSGITP
jgi:hypothetical protein